MSRYSPMVWLQKIIISGTGSSQAALCQRNHLVVDDEPTITRLLPKRLTATGRFEARAENSGTAALQTAKEFKPEVVLLDFLMPDMDGGDVKAKLVTMPECRGALTIFLTALADKDDHNTKETFLPKPANAEQIVKLIDEHLVSA